MRRVDNPVVFLCDNEFWASCGFRDETKGPPSHWRVKLGVLRPDVRLFRSSLIPSTEMLDQVRVEEVLTLAY